MRTGLTVEIFKTNVEQTHEADLLLDRLTIAFPEHKINFDLDDCDNILRVEGLELQIDLIVDILRDQGYNCEVLT